MQTPLTRAVGSGQHVAATHAWLPSSHPQLCTESRSRTLARARKEQKNKGLYFDYEPVDPETHKQLPVEQEKRVEEFSWVRRARNPMAPTRPQRPRRPESSRPAVARSPPSRIQTTSKQPSQPTPSSELLVPSAPEARASPPPPTATQVEMPATKLPLADTKSQSVAEPQPLTALPQPTPALSSSSPGPAAAPAQAVAGESEGRQQSVSRKSALLARLNKPAPTATPQQTATVDAGQAAGGSQPGVAAAAAVAAAVAGAAAAPQQALGSALPQFELPPLPAASNMDEEEALAALEAFSQLSEADVTAVQGLDLSAVTDLERSEQAQFTRWMQDVQAQQQQRRQQQSTSGNGGSEAEDSRELAEQLAAASAVESSVSSLLSEGGAQLEAFRQLLGDLGAVDTAALDDAADEEPPELNDQQLLAQLRATDPELYALLAPGDGLDWGAEDEALERALDSMQRLGLGSTDAAAPAASAGPESDAVATSGGGGAEDDEEELMSDEELQRLARADPDLARLLQSNSLGRDFERLLEPEGLAEEGFGDGLDGEEEEAEFADLFDAIEEDPDLDDADRERAKFELQSMFNLGAGGRAGAEEERPARPAPAADRGLTTTGAAGASAGEGQELPQLIPRPRMKQ